LRNPVSSATQATTGPCPGIAGSTVSKAGPASPHRSTAHRRRSDAAAGACAGRCPAPGARPSARRSCAHRAATTLCSRTEREPAGRRGPLPPPGCRGRKQAVPVMPLAPSWWRSQQKPHIVFCNRVVLEKVYHEKRPLGAGLPPVEFELMQAEAGVSLEPLLYRF
jgi:hypothetical protein